MAVEYLRFPHKRIRASEIKKYMKAAGYKKAVCFSCGNAARELQNVGVDVLHIGTQGDLVPNKWFKQEEINAIFPDYFDATSGHLPVQLMLNLAVRFREYLGNTVPDIAYIPTGSGETLVCLKIAYPEKKFIAVYNIDDATKYEEAAPLNKLVELLAYDVVK